MALLGVGMLILLRREQWDLARARLARWWLEGLEDEGSVLDPA